MTTVVLIVIAIVALPLLFITFIGWIADIIPLDTVIILLMLNVFLFSGWLLIKNKKMWRLMGHLPVVLIFLSAAYGNYIGGMGAPAIIMYVLVIMMAGILLGRKRQWLMAAACLFVYISIALADHYGYLVIERSDQTMFINRVSIAVATILGISALLHFLISQFELALDHSRLKQDKVYELALNNQRLYEESRLEIAERKKADEALKESLNEKEVLLKEIHHRVKNNLNVIVALIGLQSDKEKNDDARESLNVTRNRIFAIALIHELLYRMEDLSKIDFGFYITELVRQLHGVYLTKDKKILESINVKNITLDITRAVPCGILINEILTNAYKHAFRDRDSGNIFIEMVLSGDAYVLTISDDGVGLPGEAPGPGDVSLGMELIRLLAISQLKGDILYWSDNGLKYRITIPAVVSDKHGDDAPSI